MQIKENSLMNYSNFKIIDSEIYGNNDYNFDLKLNITKNIYYSWRNSKIL